MSSGYCRQFGTRYCEKSSRRAGDPTDHGVGWAQQLQVQEPNIIHPSLCNFSVDPLHIFPMFVGIVGVIVHNEFFCLSEEFV